MFQVQFDFIFFWNMNSAFFYQSCNFGKPCKYYLDFFKTYVKNNYHHLHKDDNSSEQLQFLMFKDKLLTICFSVYKDWIMGQ